MRHSGLLSIDMTDNYYIASEIPFMYYIGLAN
jgi:hypothetical protein